MSALTQELSKSTTFLTIAIVPFFVWDIIHQNSVVKYAFNDKTIA